VEKGILFCSRGNQQTWDKIPLMLIAKQGVPKGLWDMMISDFRKILIRARTADG
jgi:hypothetical protein